MSFVGLRSQLLAALTAAIQDVAAVGAADATDTSADTARLLLLLDTILRHGLEQLTYWSLAKTLLPPSTKAPPPRPSTQPGRSRAWLRLMLNTRRLDTALSSELATNVIQTAYTPDAILRSRSEAFITAITPLKQVHFALPTDAAFLDVAAYNLRKHRPDLDTVLAEVSRGGSLEMSTDAHSGHVTATLPQVASSVGEVPFSTSAVDVTLTRLADGDNDTNLMQSAQRKHSVSADTLATELHQNPEDLSLSHESSKSCPVGEDLEVSTLIITSRSIPSMATQLSFGIGNPSDPDLGLSTRVSPPSSDRVTDDKGADIGGDYTEAVTGRSGGETDLQNEMCILPENTFNDNIVLSYPFIAERRDFIGSGNSSELDEAETTITDGHVGTGERANIIYPWMNGIADDISQPSTSTLDVLGNQRGRATSQPTDASVLATQATFQETHPLIDTTLDSLVAHVSCRLKSLENVTGERARRNSYGLESDFGTAPKVLVDSRSPWEVVCPEELELETDTLPDTDQLLESSRSRSYSAPVVDSRDPLGSYASYERVKRAEARRDSALWQGHMTGETATKLHSLGSCPTTAFVLAPSPSLSRQLTLSFRSDEKLRTMVQTRRGHAAGKPERVLILISTQAVYLLTSAGATLQRVPLSELRLLSLALDHHALGLLSTSAYPSIWLTPANGDRSRYLASLIETAALSPLLRISTEPLLEAVLRSWRPGETALLSALVHWSPVRPGALKHSRELFAGEVRSDMGQIFLRLFETAVCEYENADEWCEPLQVHALWDFFGCERTPTGFRVTFASGRTLEYDVLDADDRREWVARLCLQIASDSGARHGFTPAVLTLTERSLLVFLYDLNTLDMTAVAAAPLQSLAALHTGPALAAAALQFAPEHDDVWLLLFGSHSEAGHFVSVTSQVASETGALPVPATLSPSLALFLAALERSLV